MNTPNTSTSTEPSDKKQPGNPMIPSETPPKNSELAGTSTAPGNLGAKTKESTDKDQPEGAAPKPDSSKKDPATEAPATQGLTTVYSPLTGGVSVPVGADANGASVFDELTARRMPNIQEPKFMQAFDAEGNILEIDDPKHPARQKQAGESKEVFKERQKALEEHAETITKAAEAKDSIDPQTHALLATMEIMSRYASGEDQTLLLNNAQALREEVYG